MNRRAFVAGGVAAAGVAVARYSFAQRGGAPVRVRVDARQPLGAIAPGFMGLGYEISSVAQPGLLGAANRVYVQMVRTLGAAGVIRIGGNTADDARYAKDGAAISRPRGTVVNDASLDALGGFLRATGWKLIWGLNLGGGGGGGGNSSEANAIAEAEAVTRFAGDHLLAFEIGNEPDLFPNSGHRAAPYSYEQWLGEYRRAKAVLRARLPRIPLAGPDEAGGTDWATRFAADEGRDIRLLTHHYYRGGERDPSTSIAKLLGPDPKLQPQLDALRAASERAHVPYRICEVNSFSGGGRPGVSDTLASALWALDFMYMLAMNGCSGVNMETGVDQLGFVSSYSPIGDDLHGNYAARPEYYGMLAFALGGQGRLLRAQVDGAFAVRAYATRQTGGSIAVTLINKSGGSVQTQLQMSGLAADVTARVTRLLGPSVDAKSEVMLGGAIVGAAGRWAPATRERVAVHSGAASVSLPPWSAAVVQID